MIKLKRIFALVFSVGLLVMAGCEPNEEIYEEFDKADIGHKKNIEITLSGEDYATIASMAAHDNPGDSINTAFFAANEYFTDSIAAADYVPYYLNVHYPAFAKGSKADVTFNYHGEMPGNFAYYADPDRYVLSDDDYASVSMEVGIAKYFYPDRPASVYLPGILDSAIYQPEEGEEVLISYKESDVNPVIDTSASQNVAIFEEKFSDETNGLGQFANFNVNGPQNWKWQEYDDGCVTMTGYVEGETYENENWLISQPIDLSDVEEATLTFRHAINYINEQFDQVDVLITADFNVDDTANTQWTSLQVPNWTTGASWTFESSGDIDLNNYLGETIRLGFKYLSSTENAGTWEIGEVTISKPGNAAITGEEPYTTQMFYEYTDNGWEKQEDTYFVNTYDYDQMGTPGNYDNFSSSAKPADYIPSLLDYRFPLAGEGVSKMVVYDYYTGENTVTLASEYTREAGTWKSAWDYVQPLTQQFLVGDERGEWVFDPTVRFEMASADYQIIVDAIKEIKGQEYIDSYGTGEFYSGANSYYGNFDLRISKRVEFEPEIFEGLEEEAAMDTIINRLPGSIEILLRNKYPDAVPAVSGIPVHYIVTFETYNNDYSRSTWKADMLCVEAATDNNPPRFELVDGMLMRDGEEVIVE